MEKVNYMIVFGGDTIADYTIYEDKVVAETVLKEKYSKYNCYVIHLPVKEKEVDLSYELAKMIANAIDENNHDVNIDDFYDSVNIPESDRTDFGTASIMKDANKYLDKWGY